MIKYIKYLRNKYILTLVVFSIYVLFLEEADVFSVIRQRVKLSKLQTEKSEIEMKYQKTRATLEQLNSIEALERFAREEKLFKRDDEDIFVIVYEE